MATTSNFDSFRNTSVVATGFSSLYNDGSAIIAGSEPIMTPDMNFAGNWTIEFFIRPESNDNMCLLSIPDGTGSRYFDVYVEGNTVKTYYEGTEDVHTYTTDSTPLTEFFHVAICYNTSTNTLYTAVDPSTSVSGTTINSVVTNDLSVANDTGISLMKPVHADADYFNGYIGALRVRNNYFNYSAATYNIQISQAELWEASSVYPIASLDPVVLTVTQTTNSTSGPDKYYHSWTKYSDTEAIVSSADVWGGNVTKRYHIASSESSFTTLYSISGLIAAAGSHYYANSGMLLTVNRDNDDVMRVDTNGTSADVVTINNGGYYLSGRGDHEDRYFFGFKLAADNSTYQIFRMEEDGSNEITVDVSSLTGTNENVYGLAINDDDETVFFHDATTGTLRSVGYDLSAASHQTYSLTLQLPDRGDMDYSQGFLYFGGVSPVTKALNNNFYRFDLETEEVLQLVGGSQSIRGGFDGTIDVFIHRPLNRMWISGESNTITLEPDNFDIYTNYITRDSVGLGTLDISWIPVDGATSYNVLQDGVAVVSGTSSTSAAITGLGTSGTSYKFTIEYSTDGVSYETARYYKFIYTAGPRIYVQEALTLTNWNSPQAVYGALDPYDPVEFVIDRNNNTYKFNVETDTETEIAPYRIQLSENLVATRGWGNKRFYVVPNSYNTRIYDLGIGCENLNDFVDENAFYGSNNLVFTASEQIRCITSLFSAKQIYYGTSTEIRRVDMDGTGDVSILTTTAYVRGIGIDPHNDDTIVYTSGNRLYYYSISSDVSTDVTSTTLHGNTHDIQVLNGRIYAQYYNRPFDYGLFSVDINGDNYYGVSSTSINGSSAWTLARQFLLNHEDKTIFAIDRAFSQTTIYDANIGTLPTDPSTLLIKSSPVGIELEWSEHPDAVKYGVSYSLGNDGENTPNIESLELPVDKFTYRIRGTQSNTTYTVYFYYGDDDNSPASTLITSTTVTTPAGTGGASDYETSFFEREGGDGFDLTTLPVSSFAIVSDVLNELFTTGDEIDIPVNGKKVITKFVRRGESAQVEEGLSIAIPFSSDEGAGQSASLTLSDGVTSVAVTFDENTEEVTVGGIGYSTGQSFTLDGKKVTIFSV